MYKTPTIKSKKYNIEITKKDLYFYYDEYKKICKESNKKDEILECLDWMELHEIPLEKVDAILDVVLKD